MGCKAVCEREQAQRSLPLPIAKDLKDAAAKTVDGEPGYMRRLRAHDATAFRELVERYQNNVFSFVFHIVGSRDEADDISLSVFADFHSSIQRLKDEGEVLPSLYRLAMRLSCGYIRNSRGRTSGAGAAALASRKDLVDLLAALTEEERVLLLLRELERYAVADLASLFSADEEMIRARLLRARQKLRQGSPKNAPASY